MISAWILLITFGGRPISIPMASEKACLAAMEKSFDWPRNNYCLNTETGEVRKPK